MVHELIKEEIKELMKQADEDTDIDFLSTFGAYRKKLVYVKKVISNDKFDELCKEILDELKD